MRTVFIALQNYLLYYILSACLRCALYQNLDQRGQQPGVTDMRLTFRSLLTLAVPTLVLLALFFQAYNWHVHFAEFQFDPAVASVMTGLALLALLAVTAPNRGLPNILRRDMMEAEHGRIPVPAQPGAASGSSKAHRTSAFSGGHVAGFAGQMMRLIAGDADADGQPRLMLSRAGA